MTTDELCEILSTLRRVGSETPHVEAKKAKGGLPRKLYETLSAFANSPGGGVIVLGVDELAGFANVSLDDPAKVQSDLASQCDQMMPPLRPLIGLHEVDGAIMLTAEVAELSADQKPCYYQGAGMVNGSFIRVGDGDRQLTPYEVQAFLDSRGQPRYDVTALEGTTPEDLLPERYRPMVDRLRTEVTHFRGLSDERILRSLHALVPDAQGSLVASLYGWLCFAAYPQERFPNLCVTFTHFPANRGGEVGPRGERTLDDKRIEGPLPAMVTEAIQVIKRSMQKRGIVQGLYRDDLWEYPELVLREALINALGHRDLAPAGRGAQVQIHMYPDRLEIISPGGLFGPIMPDQLGEMGVQSSRNEYLMRALEDLPAAGDNRPMCENRGTGLAAMVVALREAGLSPPRFDVSPTRFKLMLSNHTLYDPETLRWLEAATRGHTLGESQRQALVYLHHVQRIVNADYCRLTGLDSRVATRELSDLVERGLIDRDGVGRWTGYRLAAARPGTQLPLLTPEVAAVTAPTGAGRPRAKKSETSLLALFAKTDTLSSREIATAMNVPLVTVRYWLRSLRDAGVLEMTGSHPNALNNRYRLKPPPP